MPVSLACSVCGLNLSKHGHLYHLGLGDVFTVTELLEPGDYFELAPDPADYYEPDYGND